MSIKKFEFNSNICNFEIISNDSIYDSKLSRLYILQPYFYLRRSLIFEIENFAIDGYKFSHISKMTLTFIANFNNITYEYYLKQPESVLGWRLIEKLVLNPQLIKAFDRTLRHPPIREYSNVDTLKNRDQFLELMM